MARARMSDEEREAKRKARVAHSFSDAAYHVLADSAPARPPSVGWW